MALDLSSVQQFTDAQLLTLYRNAMAQLAVSQSTTLNGQTVTRASLPAIRENIQWLEQRIQDDANAATGGNIALSQFNAPLPGI